MEPAASAVVRLWVSSTGRKLRAGDVNLPALRSMSEKSISSCFLLHGAADRMPSSIELQRMRRALC